MDHGTPLTTHGSGFVMNTLFGIVESKDECPSKRSTHLNQNQVNEKWTALRNTCHENSKLKALQM